MKVISYLLMICVLVVSQAQANVVCCQSEINAHANTKHQHNDCHPAMAESTPPANVDVQMDHNGITLDDNSCDCPECISHSCCGQQINQSNTGPTESLQVTDNREPTHIPAHIDRPPTHIL